MSLLSEKMEDKLNPSSVVQNITEGSFHFSGISCYMNTRKDGLSNLFDNFVKELGSENLSSPVSRRDPLQNDLRVGSMMANLLMKVFVSSVSAMAEAPFSRITVLLQNQGELIKSCRLDRPYKGITDCFVRTVRNEGFLSLWRGSSVSLISILPHQVLSLGFHFAFGKIVFNLRKDKCNNKNLFYEVWAAQTGANVCSYVLLYPLEYANTRLAADVKCGKRGIGRQFTGLFDVYRKTLRSEGIMGVYRGINIACAGVVIDCGFDQLMYGSKKSKPSLKKIVLNSTIAVSAFLVPYPFETVHKRMMMTSGEASKYKSSIHAISQIVKNEGFRALYKGYGANLLRLIPTYFFVAGYRKLEKDTYKFGDISVAIQRK